MICIDIDQKGNEHISNFSELKQELFKIKNVAYAGLSASGNGFFLIIPIAYPKRHKQHFNAIQDDLSAYGITIDAAPQNVASLRGYSFDENALFRHDAIPYRRWAIQDDKEKAVSKNITPKTCQFHIALTIQKLKWNLLSNISLTIGLILLPMSQIGFGLLVLWLMNLEKMGGRIFIR